MTYTENGFRSVYHRFIALELTDNIRETLKRLPSVETADCVLCYGYHDRERGITLQVVAAGNRIGDQFTFGDSNPEVRHIIRIEVVNDVPFYVLEDENGALSERYDIDSREWSERKGTELCNQTDVPETNSIRVNRLTNCVINI